MQIPNRLKELDFRFFLIKKNQKEGPYELKWNSEGGGNYPFFHSKVINHIKSGGNLGIVTGIAGLIVIDFDDYQFYETVMKKLPFTFTTISATKRAPHYYYILKGDMIKKIGIDNFKGKRVCDIQAYRCGIVAPGSSIDRRYYSVHNDLPIADITLEKLDEIFDIKGKIKKPTEWKGEIKTDNEAVLIATEILKYHKLKQTGERHFTCPFHSSTNGKNLSILSDGSIYCFHTQTYWYDIQKFVDELIDYRNNR